jgi:hypothetical protein
MNSYARKSGWNKLAEFERQAAAVRQDLAALLGRMNTTQQ